MNTTTTRSSSRGRHQDPTTTTNYYPIEHYSPDPPLHGATTGGKKFRKTVQNFGEENNGPWMRAAAVADQNRMNQQVVVVGTPRNPNNNQYRSASASKGGKSSLPLDAIE